jgi:spore germination protein YaaH
MANVVYQKQKTITKRWVLSGLLFSLIVIISSILFIFYPFASREKVSYFDGENPILYNEEQVGNALMDGDVVYVPLTFMKNQVDEQLFFDEKSNSVILTTSNKVIQMPTESLTYFVNEEPVQLQMPILKDQNGALYIALDPILTYYSMQYTILPKTNAIALLKDGTEKRHGTINAKDVHEEKLRLRTEPSLQSPYSAQTVDGEEIIMEKEEEEFYFIRKDDGTGGYLNKKYVKEGKMETIHTKNEQNEVIPPQIEGPIHLTWEAVYTRNPNTATIPAMPGVNVVSPTWFELSGSDGTIKNLGSIDYVNWAKEKGYQVWGLFSNAFDPDLTHEALQHYETRQKIIRQLLHYSQMYQLNGINLDIENVREEDGPLVTQFVREATPYFHEAGLIVSMDITFITTGNWSAFYERDKLAETVDYLVVMAYDEHWATSREAGSVASFPWVEQNLQKLLEVVPNEKLILGVPLYARLWEEKETGELSSKALSMAEVKEWLTAHNVTPKYDEISGQNYAEYYDAATKSTYRIWLEDELSLKKRVDVAFKYNLKGIASWSRYFADETAWLALSLENKQVVQNE